MSQTKIAVIGGGSWGTALANVFADASSFAGSMVSLWARDEKQLAEIESYQENSKYLKGIKLSAKLRVTRSLEKSLAEGDIVVCSIPTQSIRAVFSPFAEVLSGKLVVNTSKGIEKNTHARVSEIFSQIAPGCRYAIVSGPSFALETAKRLPTAVTVAATIAEDAENVQKFLATPYFRAYTSRDVVGVELAGALKNVIAIASGMVSGLQLGYNAQAAIINRGMAEILRLGKKLGAEPLTFLGLAGMGDLILTCTGPLSRNRRVGQLLGEGIAWAEIPKLLGGVAEGVYTAESALELAQKNKVETPILQQVFSILYQNGTPEQALTTLMGRDLREEW